MVGEGKLEGSRVMHIYYPSALYALNDLLQTVLLPWVGYERYNVAIDI